MESCFYTLCNPIIVGCTLYQDNTATTLVTDGFYSDGTNCHQVTSGIITTITTCSSGSTGNIVIQQETNEICFGGTSLRVYTNTPLKVNMTGTFDIGATYHTDIGYRSSNIVNEVISGLTVYNFGIEAANGGTLSYNSNIVFTINDYTTGDIIDSYTYSRNHNGSPC